MFRLRPHLARRSPLPQPGLRPRDPRPLWLRSRALHSSPRRPQWNQAGHLQDQPVRIAGPVIWCITATGVIYLGCAVNEVLREVRSSADTRRGWRFQRSQSSYEDLDSAQRQGRTPSSHAPLGVFDGSGSPLGLWRSLPEVEKLVLANVALNTSLYFTQGAIVGHFYHFPVYNRNYTMFTSIFNHSSVLHLALNMYLVYRFAQPVAYSPTFGGSGSHLAAFYLSSGVLSCLALQLEAAVPSRRFVAGAGSGGVLMALLGAFAMSNPDTAFGLPLLPGSVSASTLLICTAAFDTYGLLFGIPWFRVNHSTNLAGLAFGAAYIHFDGRKRLWEPTKKLAFNVMRRFGAV
jgi:rhomboid-like protein